MVWTSSGDQKELIKAQFDRQALECGAVIGVQQETHELTSTEVDTLMLRWLRVDARVGGPKDTHTESAYRHQTPDRRGFAREVGAEKELELEDDVAEVAAVREGKIQGQRQRQPHRCTTSHTITSSGTHSGHRTTDATTRQPSTSDTCSSASGSESPSGNTSGGTDNPAAPTARALPQPYPRSMGQQQQQWQLARQWKLARPRPKQWQSVARRLAWTAVERQQWRWQRERGRRQGRWAMKGPAGASRSP